MKFALAASFFAAIVVVPVAAGECGTFGTDFGACLNWCSDTNPGAERSRRSIEQFRRIISSQQAIPTCQPLRESKGDTDQSSARYILATALFLLRIIRDQHRRRTARGRH
ncbi:hypothetical protein CFIO01_00747 [Colletotrichum fioriniae PJ7]|uniref:Uncharacterized protein n=1 Tax=Colletotrichum fioriniae PJ7 TaxID=1445577 RepID=A0A010R4E5_9PEZI|nr:hypothetical protein CFIO01_00747 [Colletotrichum fioriniae PJ7]